MAREELEPEASDGEGPCAAGEQVAGACEQGAEATLGGGRGPGLWNFPLRIWFSLPWPGSGSWEDAALLTEANLAASGSAPAPGPWAARSPLRALSDSAPSAPAPETSRAQVPHSGPFPPAPFLSLGAPPIINYFRASCLPDSEVDSGSFKAWCSPGIPAPTERFSCQGPQMQKTSRPGLF